MPVVQNVTTDEFSLPDSETKSGGIPRTLGQQIAARQRALEEIDRANFGWYHVRAIAVAGSGFFTDAYDFFSISLVSTMLGYVYYRDSTNKGALPSKFDEALKISTGAGAVVGQLGFGWLCDKLGRKRMYGVSILIMTFGTLATALSGEGPGLSAIGAIVFWRAILGIGIGGDYPMAAVITSEFASTRHRGRMMAAVFSMQGVDVPVLCLWLTLKLGIVTAALVFYFSLLSFRESIVLEDKTILIPTNPADPSAGLPAVDRVWRLVVGFGCIPAVISLYYRLTIPETPRYTIDVERDIVQGEDDVDGFLNLECPRGKDKSVPHPELEIIPTSSCRDFIMHFRQWQYGKVLLGTAGCWFFLDFAFYGLGLNNSVILQAIGFAETESVYDQLHSIAIGNIIIQFAGTLPGYWFSIAFVDIIGRKKLQLSSFAILTVLFAIIGFAYYPLYEQPSKGGFITLFVMLQFFMNFGANTTTFIVPGEVFPTRYRSTAYGISAASGKLGAVIAEIIFPQLKDFGGQYKFMNHLLQIFALFMICGFCLSWLIPETKGRTLEEISGENTEDMMRQVFEENRRLREFEMAMRAQRRSQIEQRRSIIASELAG